MPAQAPVLRLPHRARWNSPTRTDPSRATWKAAGTDAGENGGVGLPEIWPSRRSFSGSRR